MTDRFYSDLEVPVFNPRPLSPPEAGFVQIYGTTGRKLAYQDADGKETVLLNQWIVGEIRHSRFPLGAGWLLLDGKTYQTADYPALAALYGATGATFAVDDWRGLPIFGADATNAAGAIVGADTADLSHTHGVGTLAAASAGAHNHGGNTGSVAQQATGIIGLTGFATPTHSHTISTDGAHTHTLSGSTASALTTLDKRPKRAYALTYIRALP